MILKQITNVDPTELTFLAKKKEKKAGDEKEDSSGEDVGDDRSLAICIK